MTSSNARLSRFVEAASRGGIDQEVIDLFSPVVVHSEFLGEWLIRFPEEVGLAHALLDRDPTPETMIEEMRTMGMMAMDEADFDAAIRRYKMREYCVIAVRDLSLDTDVKAVTAHLSAFASAACSLAVDYSMAALSALHGVPRDEEGNPVGFCVIGLGKLGGIELNFSSDIDIVYVYGTELGKTDDTGKKPPIENHKFFTRVAESVTSRIGTRTADGLVFRVDLRLRPDGDRGPIALPVHSYGLYYESYGQSWERMMLLKARPVAGDMGVGKEFLADVKPFVFRRSLDHKLFEDLKDVKRRIDRREELKGGDVKNVKLGYGGIREIEFFVQSLQILNYPRYDDCFRINTLEGLDRLLELSIIDEAARDDLAAAYRLLRRLEHMAQIERELQTHVIPDKSATFELYVERAGFNTPYELLEAYRNATETVHGYFTDLFAETDGSQASDLFVFDHDLSVEEVADILEERGVDDAKRCVTLLRRIVDGSKIRPRLASEKKVLTGILLPVIKELPRLNDPAETLLYLERFFTPPPVVFLFHEIFMEAPQMLDSLLNLLSSSRYLSDIMVKNSNLLDYIYDPQLPVYKASDLEAAFRDAISACGPDDVECELDLLRMKHKEYMFNLGYSFLNKSVNIINTLGSLTELARAVLTFTFERVMPRLVERYGQPMEESGEPARFTVIGMGKLGSHEMSFGSDLDLIVLFSAHGQTDGDRQISNQEFFSKLVQKAIADLSTMTTQGYLYKIDMRLRPSGASGTLVTTISAFEEYQQKSAMVWEKQALLRAEVMTGDDALGEAFERIRTQALFSRPLGVEGINEVFDMRMRVEEEKGSPPSKNDLKAGTGGLVDVEFAVQMLQLEHGHAHERLQGTNTHRIIHYLRSLDILSRRDFNSLHQGYVLFRNLENLIRVYENSSSSRLPANPVVLEKLGAFMGFKPGEGQKVLEEYLTVRRSVRGAFTRIFEKARGGSEESDA